MWVVVVTVKLSKVACEPAQIARKLAGRRKGYFDFRVGSDAVVKLFTSMKQLSNGEISIEILRTPSPTPGFAA